MAGLSSSANVNIRRAVFIDRDGVINRMFFDPEFGTVDSPANPDQLALLPGVGRAIAALNRLGLLVIVVSNQPGIAKGKFTRALLEAMQGKMISGIEAEGGKLDAIYNCLHHPDASVVEYQSRCECRKPLPGLLLKAAQEWNIDLDNSYMVGDGVTDIAAGRAAGTTTLFVNSRKCYNCDALAVHGVWPHYLVSDLGEAAMVIESLEAGQKDSVRHFIMNCAAL
jgi:D-glycero-D-manno-heptose 1,7-bisphosphate phosphatase